MIGLLITAWFCTLAPIQIGGPLTYAMVSGHSMEPQLHTGDLVVTKQQSRYKVGDDVIASVMGGFVIHRVVHIQGASLRTKGINNQVADSWTLRSNQVLGKLIFAFPGAGSVLVFLRTHPLVLALTAALIAGLVNIDPRKRKNSKRLQGLLSQAQKETTKKSYDFLSAASIGFFVLAVSSLLLVAILTVQKYSFFPRIFLSMAGAIVALTTYEALGRWIANGRDLPEPLRSLEVLKGTLFRFESTLVFDGLTQNVKSARELRNLVDIANQPVLHVVDESNAYFFQVNLRR